MALRHILRPVLTPVVTQLGLIMITIVNGAIFVELVFGLPGLGRLTVKALTNTDYPVILADHADRLVPGHGLEPAGRRALSAARPARQRHQKRAADMTDRPLTTPAEPISSRPSACGAMPGTGCSATGLPSSAWWSSLILAFAAALRAIADAL